MKVLFITRKFPPSIGGMEQFAYELSTALAAKTTVKLVKWGGTGRVKAVLIALPYLTNKAAWTLLRGGIDVIQAQDGVVAPVAYVLAKLWRKPLVVTIHGLDATYGNRLFRAVVPWVVRRAGAVICISQATANEVAKLGVNRAKIQVIPLAVVDKYDPKLDRATARQQLELPANAKLLLTVGRLEKRKGVSWFINDVLPGLAKQYPDLLYLVVGEGAERPAAMAAIAKNNLTEQVRLLGRVSGQQLAAAYGAADIFVMPNINVPGDMEGFGLVLLEASTHKLPVVAANTEGIADAVSGDLNGVLVPVGDAVAFEREIKSFLDDPAGAKRFGARSRDFTLANYQWDKIADRYLEQYQRLLH